MVRDEEAREAEERRQAGVRILAGDVGVNLLTDDPLAVDGRLPAVLLDNAPRLGGRCGARVWRARRDQPVLAQCQAGCADGVEFCGAHRLEEQRPFGTWDPE